MPLRVCHESKSYVDKLGCQLLNHLWNTETDGWSYHVGSGWVSEWVHSEIIWNWAVNTEMLWFTESLFSTRSSTFWKLSSAFHLIFSCVCKQMKIFDASHANWNNLKHWHAFGQKSTDAVSGCCWEPSHWNRILKVCRYSCLAPKQSILRSFTTYLVLCY